MNPSHDLRTRPHRTWAALALSVAASGLMAAGAQAHTEKPHQHGVAQLDVVLDGGTLTLDLDTPLDNLLGFERAPRTEAERQRVAAMRQALQSPGTLFVVDPAARCTAAAPKLEAPVLGLGTPAAQPVAGGPHADMEASFRFDCAAPQALAAVQLQPLFQRFPGLKRLEVQVVGPKGQARRVLTAADARLDLPR